MGELGLTDQDGQKVDHEDEDRRRNRRPVQDPSRDGGEDEEESVQVRHARNSTRTTNAMASQLAMIRRKNLNSRSFTAAPHRA